jgi:ribosomal protein S18 acetylase RimI-like enzyme
VPDASGGEQSSYELMPATEADREFLLAVYASTREEELEPTGWSRDQKDVFLRSQFDLQDRHYRDVYRDAAFDIIRAGTDRVGRLYVDRMADLTLILDIALLPEHRNHGLGSSILEDLQREVGAAAQPLGIHVEKNNRALAWYLRLGFLPVEDLGIYLFMKWSPGSTDVRSPTEVHPL